MSGLDHTHDALARSWLASANAEGADFPIQNLPFAVFRRTGEAFRGGVAIGDRCSTWRRWPAAAGSSTVTLLPTRSPLPHCLR